MKQHKVNDNYSNETYIESEENLFSLAKEYAERMNNESEDETEYKVISFDDVIDVLECANIYVSPYDKN